MKELITIENLKDIYCIAIFGERGSGKTALAFKFLDELSKTFPIYLMRHPNMNIIEEVGLPYKNLKSLERLCEIQDCVVYWDEPQLSVDIRDKSANKIIAQICSLARQRNIKIIISSSDTRVFTKHNESFFDMWLVKDLDYAMVKNGSKIKRVVLTNTFFDPNGFKLKCDEYLSYSRKLPEELNGKHKFGLITIWNDKLSKPFILEEPVK